MFSNHLSTTNVYLQLEILESGNFESRHPLESTEIFPKEFSSLPASCKDIHINLLHKQSQPTNYELLTCCKQLQVFEDFVNLNLDLNTEEATDIINEKNGLSLPASTSAWWEAEIFVRGFKDQPIKGFNVWT